MTVVLEQYTTKLKPEEHQRVLSASEWLIKNGFLKNKNKYRVTKYALTTLVAIVEEKQQRESKEKSQKKLQEKPASPKGKG